ncbi:hypothetical protein BHE90_003732 [Fusarium euwallaceae]|uniref:Uncharacterized protein n=1 Tax=Fusarium euwallaceae TaxID=1147111 RepID=A0A430M177_9HYPO|nr:hypothetical protein BHE90_003732 [Fusarium euwallaceae]
MSAANQLTGATPRAIRNLPPDTHGNEFGGSIELSVSAFDLDRSSTIGRTLATQLIKTFNNIKIIMDKALASELAEFLPRAWEQHVLSKVNFPAKHDFYKRMRGSGRDQKELYYPYWFFLAVTWGVNHPSLLPIRKDMAALWGVGFPDIYSIYPPGIPAERQRVFFHGGPEKPIPLLQMERRAQDFKAVIEGVGRPSVIEAVTKYAPALLKKAVPNDEVESLQRKLKDTQEQLQKTQGQLNDTQKRLRETNDELQETRKKLKSDTESSSKDIAAVNLRVDKVVDTCALVLSILTTPGGEKRTLEAEQDGA